MIIITMKDVKMENYLNIPKNTYTGFEHLSDQEIKIKLDESENQGILIEILRRLWMDKMKEKNE
jgi:hypothetical protein